jgi:hypothetical protein
MAWPIITVPVIALPIITLPMFGRALQFLIAILWLIAAVLIVALLSLRRALARLGRQ